MKKLSLAFATDSFFFIIMGKYTKGCGSMQRWYQLVPKKLSVTIYLWIIFSALPFFFISKASSAIEIALGITMVILFFVSYIGALVSKGWKLYTWVGIAIAISIVLTLFFGFVYFALFLAFVIGMIENKAGFLTLYAVLVGTTLVTVNIGFFTKNELFFSQFPFVIFSVLGVILLPFHSFTSRNQDRLEDELKLANERLAQLIVIEERQRIARDLHDTLGQKLSLIGLKSDLATKILQTDSEAAKVELRDIHRTARLALKEVREMVSDMRGIRLQDELIHVQQMLQAAQMEVHLEGTPKLKEVPLMVEHVLSMCLKEGVTNVVKHSEAKSCFISIRQQRAFIELMIQDDGIGIQAASFGNGLSGMKERLEFVNGTISIRDEFGTTLTIRIPHVIRQLDKEELV